MRKPLERNDRMEYKMGDYEVAVIGAGHAGIEAALAAARLGAKTAIFTMSLDAIGNMPCNPSIGGTAKGHLVREIDALGGEMGKAADATFLQSRMLNRGKGPAVHSLRVQSDRDEYHKEMKHRLELQDGLDIIQAEICDIRTDENGAVKELVTKLGAVYEVKTAIICSGTFLHGRIYVGDVSYESGPDGLHAAIGLSEALERLGIHLRRFKTGTPARVRRDSIDYSKLEVQAGDEPIIPFSFETPREGLKNQVVCHIAYTNEKTHQIIRDNIHRSPLYGGMIEGVGPRYCPSIEDKVMRFSEKPRHQSFVEPVGLHTEEMYLQGLSSSLPEDVQVQIYRSIVGFENVKIMRNAYAIEYDCIDPLDLKASLEFLKVEGLYGAGQFNGSSGYEEAACQGLIAGINAAMEIKGRDPLILDRSEAYIGVLIDDLVTKKNREPYRMMTSRAEYRLLLRQDNADLRLTKKGYEIGLISQERYDWVCKKEELIKKEIERVNEVKLGANARVQHVLEQYGSIPLHTGTTLSDLIRRPELDYDKLAEIDTDRPDLPAEVTEQVNILIKYDGYISRQIKQVEKFKKLEKKKLPEKFDYNEISGLRIEAQQKLNEFQPLNIGQASRISGVTPADISVLLVYLEQLKYSNPDLFFKLNPDEHKEKQE